MLFIWPKIIYQLFKGRRACFNTKVPPFFCLSALETWHPPPHAGPMPFQPVPDLPLCLGMLKYRAPLARGPIFLPKNAVYMSDLI
jgi:hypothetical protein